MAENQIYEISRMMRDRAATQRDMRDATALLSQFFQDRYLTKIKRAVDNSQSSVSESPPDEVRLIYALKPFIRPDKQELADKMIDMMLTMTSLKKMSADLNPDMIKDAGEAAGGAYLAGGRGGLMGVVALLTMLGK